MPDLQTLSVRIFFDVLIATASALEATDKVASKVPGYSLLRDRILDTLLGPKDEWDYESTTCPSSDPPARL